MLLVLGVTVRVFVAGLIQVVCLELLSLDRWGLVLIIFVLVLLVMGLQLSLELVVADHLLLSSP